MPAGRQAAQARLSKGRPGCGGLTLGTAQQGISNGVDGCVAQVVGPQVDAGKLGGLEQRGAQGHAAHVTNLRGSGISELRQARTTHACPATQDRQNASCCWPP